MSRRDDQTLLALLLRDSDEKPQEFWSDITKPDDDTIQFVVGRSDTGEYYRHTVKTEFVKPVEDGNGGYKPGEWTPVE